MYLPARRHWSAGSSNPGLSSSGRGSRAKNDGTWKSLIIPGGDGTANDPSGIRDVPAGQKVYDATGKCGCPRLAPLGALARPP